MSSIGLSGLLKRRTIAIALICIIIAVPLIILGHAELSYGGYPQTPSSSVQVHTLKDIWYPRGWGWEPNPLFVSGNMSSYYARPYLMCPNSVEVEIFMQDVTGSTNVSWVGVADYETLRDDGYVNTTLTPLVDGNFGDGEGYTANETEWTYWPATGLPVVGNYLEQGICDLDFSMTGYQSGDMYSICKFGLRFSTDTSLQLYQWSLLIELAIFIGEASEIAGNGMRIIVSTTMTWIPVLVVGLAGAYTEIVNITRGDGVADNGVQDYWFYMLEGYVEMRYGIGG
jgi:hypothetical protein